MLESRLIKMLHFVSVNDATRKIKLESGHKIVYLTASIVNVYGMCV